ncbi:DUF6154 family protein [Robertmurraya sp. DFI.2.37]|jgi:glycosylphosphatidylinositol transamidase (GPIT) subunit GPI8|uniref:DUF6154 family protein n=1 Tax=Robertmurraya sp. DFI.2.37 TaxID=3031819 RepID=UPI0012446614|nr:DUF6154 family protein [Robertmurraya sp. DFI.2.37]MDF1509374.1 DUF6154 family protein [Robertmurraya sp. DFI.2.37]
MKLIDEIFEFYRDKLTGDDEDIDMLAFALLEEMTYDDLMNIIKDLDKQELYDLIGLYMIETLKGKFAQESYGQQRTSSPHSRNLH